MASILLDEKAQQDPQQPLEKVAPRQTQQGQRQTLEEMATPEIQRIIREAILEGGSVKTNETGGIDIETASFSISIVQTGTSLLIESINKTTGPKRLGRTILQGRYTRSRGDKNRITLPQEVYAHWKKTGGKLSHSYVSLSGKIVILTPQEIHLPPSFKGPTRTKIDEMHRVQLPPNRDKYPEPMEIYDLGTCIVIQDPDLPPPTDAFALNIYKNDG